DFVVEDFRSVRRMKISTDRVNDQGTDAAKGQSGAHRAPARATVRAGKDTGESGRDVDAARVDRGDTDRKDIGIRQPIARWKKRSPGVGALEDSSLGCIRIEIRRPAGVKGG